MEEKWSALSQLIELAKVDGELHSEEIKFICTIGRTLNIADEKMIKLIN